MARGRVRRRRDFVRVSTTWTPSIESSSRRVARKPPPSIPSTAARSSRVAACRLRPARETRVGVFVGIQHVEYGRSGTSSSIRPFAATGRALSACAGRVSFVFGLRSGGGGGPCSASLVTIHLAFADRSNASAHACVGVNTCSQGRRARWCARRGCSRRTGGVKRSTRRRTGTDARRGVRVPFDERRGRRRRRWRRHRIVRRPRERVRARRTKRLAHRTERAFADARGRRGDARARGRRTDVRRVEHGREAPRSVIPSSANRSKTPLHARTPLTLTASKSCVGHAEAAAGSAATRSTRRQTRRGRDARRRRSSRRQSVRARADDVSVPARVRARRDARESRDAQRSLLRARTRTSSSERFPKTRRRQRRPAATVRVPPRRVLVVRDAAGRPRTSASRRRDAVFVDARDDVDVRRADDVDRARVGVRGGGETHGGVLWRRASIRVARVDASSASTCSRIRRTRRCDLRFACGAIGAG